MSDVLRQAVIDHLAARDALADAPVERLRKDDPRFAAVQETLQRMREAVRPNPTGASL